MVLYEVGDRYTLEVSRQCTPIERSAIRKPLPEATRTSLTLNLIYFALLGLAFCTLGHERRRVKQLTQDPSTSRIPYVSCLAARSYPHVASPSLFKFSDLLPDPYACLPQPMRLSMLSVW